MKGLLRNVSVLTQWCSEHFPSYKCNKGCGWQTEWTKPLVFCCSASPSPTVPPTPADYRPHDPPTRLELCPQQRILGNQGAINSRLIVCLWFTAYFHNSLLIWSFQQPTGKIDFTSPSLHMKKKTPQIYKVWGPHSILCHQVLETQDWEYLSVLYAVAQIKHKHVLLPSHPLHLVTRLTSQAYTENWNNWSVWRDQQHREGTALSPHLSGCLQFLNQKSPTCFLQNHRLPVDSGASVSAAVSPLRSWSGSCGQYQVRGHTGDLGLTPWASKQQEKSLECRKKTCREEGSSRDRRMLRQGVDLRGVHNNQHEHSTFMKLPNNSFNESENCLYGIIHFLKYCFIT